MPTVEESATSDEAQPLLVNERTAAKLLSVSPRSIWTMATRGELASVRIGRRKLYSLETLRRFIADREATVSSSAHEVRLDRQPEAAS